MTVFTGTSADNIFTIAAGSNRYDALGGNDKAIFDFALTDATISYSGNQVIVESATSHTVLTGFQTYQFTDGTVEENDGSPLVADLFYYAQNHDVWSAGIDADTHYNSVGWREGRDPNPFFNTSLYLAANPDVNASGVNPLLHFHTIGWAEGRQPSLDFSVQSYLTQNPDVAAAHVDPLWHFLQTGADEGRQPSPATSMQEPAPIVPPAAPAVLAAATTGIMPNGFDNAYYLATNPDVAAAGVDPYVHFQTTGWHEGRNPNAYFDVQGYLAANPDVAAAGINPLDHFHNNGWKEGRNPSPWFDLSKYFAANPDIAAANIDPVWHFLQTGKDEGRLAIDDDVTDRNAAENSALEGTSTGTDTGLRASWGAWAGVSYSIINDSSGGGFAVNASTGVITVANGALLDFETTGPGHVHTVTVQATKLGETHTQTFQIEIKDDPTDNVVITSGDSAIVPENISTADVVYDANASVGGVTFSITGDDASKFTIDSSTGQVRFVTSPDFESPTDVGGNNVYNITVTATGAFGSDSQDVAITVNDVNESPSLNLINTTTTIAENTVVGTGIHVANITLSDDALGTNALSLSGTDAASFELRGNALYYIGSSPNFEAKASYSVNVDANDTSIPGAVDATTPFTLNISNVNEAPVANPDTPYAVLEDGSLSVDAANGVLANDTDPDAGASLTAILISGPAHASSFTLNANGSFDYTPTADFIGSDIFVYRTTDGTLFSGPIVVTINVGAVNDDPVAANDANGIAEDVDTDPAPGVQSVATGNLLDNDNDGDPEVAQDLDVVDVDGVLPSSGTITLIDGDGTLAVNAETGGYTYTVNNGSAAVQALGVGDSIVKTFTYTVTDDGVPPKTDTATLTITIAGTNDGPVAAADTDTVTEDTDLQATGNVITNDTDVDGDTLTVTAVNGSGASVGVVVAGTYGTLNLGSTGAYTYDLNNAHAAVQALGVGETLTDQFTYTIDDGFGGVSTTTLALTINGVNDAVTLAAQTADVTEDLDVSAHGNVLDDVADLDVNDVHSVVGVVAGTGPAPTDNTGVGTTIAGIYGDLTIEANGEAHYTLRNGDANVQALAAGQIEQDVFTFAVTDNNGSTIESTVTFNAHGTNDAPVANADIGGAALQTNEDTAVNFDVRANDTDVDGTVVAVSKINGVAPAVGVPIGVIGGTVTLQANGTLTFTPTPNSTQDGNFTYRVVDNTGAESAQATVIIDVVPVNDAPVANTDNVTIIEDVPTLINLVGNDTDVDGPPLSINSIDGTLITTDGQSVAVAGGTVTVSLNPGNGTLSRVSFTPTPNSNAPSTFQYTAKDGLGSVSNTATVNVSITPVNDAPVATADTLAATQDGPAAIGNLLANDTDVEDGSPIPTGITAFAVAGVGSGTVGTPLALGNGAFLNVAANGAVTLTQNDAYDGLGAGETTQISLTYTVTDSGGASDTSSAVITVTGVNDAVTLAAQTADVTEDLDVSAHGNVLDDVADLDVNDVHNVLGVVAGAGSAATNPLTVGTEIAGLYGDLTIDADGEAHYTLRSADVQSLADGETVQDVFTFKVTDNKGSETQASVTFDVHGTNDAPVAVADQAFSTNEDTSVILDVLANDTDVDGNGPLTIASINGLAISEGQTRAVTGGTVTLNAAGFIDDMGTVSTLDDVTYANQTLTFAPGSTNSTVDSLFTYTAKDALGAESDQGIVQVDVVPQNDAPTVTPDLFTTREDTAITMNVLANDDDVESDQPTLIHSINGNPFTVGASIAVTGGTITVNANHTITFTPTAHSTTAGSFTYIAQDAAGAPSAAAATVTINVTPVNDAPAINAPDTSGTAVELLANGSFESGTLSDTFLPVGSTAITGWTTIIGQTYYNQNLWQDGEGTRSVNIASALTPAGIETTLTTVIGQTYTVEFEMAGNTFYASSHTARVTAGAESEDFTFNSAGRSNADMGWAPYTFTFTATSTTTTLQFTTLSGSPVIDSVSVDDPTANQPLSVTEDTAFAFAGPAAITISDVDSASGNLTVTLQVGNGMLTAAAAGSAAVDGSGTGTLTMTGTLADINSTLGSLAYTPDGEFNGADALIINVNDGGNTGAGGALGATRTVSLDVTAVNDAPEAVGEVAGIAEDVDTNPAMGVQSQVSGNLLANDGDGDSGTDDLDVTAVTGPGTLIDGGTTLTRTDADGSLVIDKETGEYTYTVNNGSAAVQALGIGESITKLFTYTVSDGLTDTATLTVTIAGTNDGPIANVDAASVTEDGTTSVSGNAIGALSAGTNPVGTGDAADTDIDGDTLVVVAVNGSPAGVNSPVAGLYGSLTLQADGDYTYTLTNANPAVQGLGLGETLVDSFSYRVHDGHGGFAVSRVNITINGANDAVTLAAQTAEVTEDLDASTHGNVLDDVADLDVNDVHSVVGVVAGTGPAPTDDTGVGTTIAGIYGDLTIEANGEAHYTLRNGAANVQALAAGQIEQDVFTFAVTDNNGSTIQSSVTFDVHGTNDAPTVTSAVSATVDEDDTPATFDLLSGASDVDGGTLSVVADPVQTGGRPISFTFDGPNKELTFDPDQFDDLADGQSEQVSFSYTIQDGQGGTVAQTLTVTVTGSNDAPVFTAVEPAVNAYTSGTAAVNIVTAATTLVDPESKLKSITLQLSVDANSNPADTVLDGGESLSIDAGLAASLTALGVTVTGNGNTEPLTITGVGPNWISPALLEVILEQVKYANTDTSFGFNANDREITITVTDHQDAVDTETVALDLRADVTDTSLGGSEFQGGNLDDEIDGAAGTDTAVYQGEVGDYTITVGTDPVTGFVTGFSQVQDNNFDNASNRDGTDDLTSIEQLRFQNDTPDNIDDGDDTVLSLNGAVQLFGGDPLGSGTLIGTFDTIAEALANADHGDFILVNGTGGVGGGAPVYGPVTPESITISDGITLRGLGTVTVGSITINGSGAGQDIDIDNVNVTTTSNYGVYVDPAATYSSITFQNGDVSGGVLNGFAVNDASIGSVTIQQAIFSNNGTNLPANPERGEGAILLEKYNGNVTLTNVTVQTPGQGAENGIQIRGEYPAISAGGTITLNGVTVTDSGTNKFSSTGVAIRDYVSLIALSITGAGVAVTTTGNAYAGLHLDNVGGNFDFSSVPLSVVSANAIRDVQINSVNNGTGVTLVGDDGRDLLIGGDGNDVLNGKDGSDLYVEYAGDGADTINDTGTGGGPDAVVIYGVDNPLTPAPADAQTDDTITVTTDGNDILSIDGGSVTGVELAGIDLGNNPTIGSTGDTLDYTGTTVSVTVDLVAKTGTGFDLDLDAGTGGTQSVLGVENVTGGSAGDQLTGDSGANVLKGGAGEDILTGGGGADTIEGGDDLDTANYTELYSAVESITWDGTTAKVTIGGVADTITGVGKLQFGDKTVFLVNDDVGSDYTSIQTAVTAAVAGDIVLVAAGTYDETVTIDEGITLQASQPGAIINGASGDGAVVVAANGVVVDGFGINAGLGQTAAIYLNAGISGLTISHNTITASQTVNGNQSGIVNNPGAGISNVTITENTFNGDGPMQHVYVNNPASTSVDITLNTFNGSLGGGVAVGTEAGNSAIYGNDFNGSSTYGGMELWGSDYTLVGPGPAFAKNDFTDFDAGEPGGADIRTANDDIDLNDTVGGTSVIAQNDLSATAQPIDLTGNAGDNTLVGNGAANVFDGGAGQDAIIGGGGIDTAEGYPAGWVFGVEDTGSGDHWFIWNGTDADTKEVLTGVEKVVVGTTTYLLVDDLGADIGGFQSIGAAETLATSGQIILVADGTYNENVVIDVAGVTLQALGSGVVLEGSFRTDNPSIPMGTTVGDWLETATGYSPSSGAGITISADNVTIQGLTIRTYLTGIELGTNTGLTVTNVTIEESVNGVRKGTAAVVNGFTMTGGEIIDGYIGMNIAAAVGAGAFDDVTIDGVAFRHLTEKGIYAEQLSNAEIMNIIMYDVGQFGRGPAFGPAAQTGEFGNGIDINLKYGTYSNIDIHDFNFTNVGLSAGVDTVPEDFGAAIVIKARDDAPSYSGSPASASNVTVSNGTIDGTSTGIRTGEPGKNIGTPAVTVTNVAITNETVADYDNVTQSTLTVNTTTIADNDSVTFASTTTGNVVVNGGADNNVIASGAGADTLAGGAGDDTITGRAGADSLIGGEGDDIFYHVVGDGNDRVDGGSEAAGGTHDDTLDVTNTGGAVTFNIGTVTGPLPADEIVPDTGTDATDILLSYGSGSVRMDEIEDIQINLGSGGDTVNINTPLGGTGLSVSTITIEGGASGDTVNAGAMTSGHHIVFNGGSGDDLFVTGGGDDTFDGGDHIDTVSFANAGEGISVTLNGSTAATVTHIGDVNGESDSVTNVENVIGTTFADTITGDDNDNVITANGGSDVLAGGDGIDTVIVTGAIDTYTVTVSPAGTITLDSGTDQIQVASDVENLTFAGGVTVDLTSPVRVLDAGGHLVATYATIGAAVSAGSTVDGYTVQILGKDGIGPDYVESVTVSKALNFVGVDVGNGLPTISSTGTAFTLSGTIGGGSGAISFSNLVITDAVASGIRADASLDMGALSLVDVVINNSANYGIDVSAPVNGAVASLSITETAAGESSFSGNKFNAVFVDNAVGSVTIAGSSTSDPIAFADNGLFSAAGAGAGDISLFQFNGSALLTHLTLTNVGASSTSGAQTGIQLRADAGVIGNVTLDDITVNGSYGRQPIAVFNYDNVDALTMKDVTVNADSTGFGHAINIDGVGGNVDLTNVTGAGAKFDNVTAPNLGLNGDNVAVQGDNGVNVFKGSADANLLRGFDGADTFTGGAGADLIIGGDVGSDNSNGDTAIYTDTLDVGEFSYDIGTGFWTVTTSSEGVDTLRGVEIIEHGGPGRILLVDQHAAGAFSTIQAAVAAAVSGDTIIVAPGNYTGNIVISTSNITLLSSGGRDVTTITGNGAGGELGTIVLAPGVNGVRIGSIDGLDNHGFTIIGIDGTPGLEKAAVYLQGAHDEIDIQGNDIVANGDAGLISEFGQAITDIRVDNNIFSGQTFNGPNPAGVGSGAQFTLLNVPRQLVVMGDGSGASTISGTQRISFTNNDITGTAGGISLTDNAGLPNAPTPQGNSLVTIDANGSVISGNDFTGYTTGGGFALRARGPNTDIIDNELDHTTGGNSAGIFVDNKGLPGNYSGNSVEGAATGDVVTSMTPGADTINGNAGNDILTGSGGADEIDGGADDDVILIASPADHPAGETIEGGSGTDTIRFTSATGGQTLVLTSGVTGVEEVEISDAAGGNAGTTALNVDASAVTTGLTVTGNNGANTLSGTGEADVLVGNGGADSFTSGAGSDTIWGGTTASDDANTTIDTATYGGGAIISWDDANGIWKVDDGDGIDTLHGIEHVVIGGVEYWLVDDTLNGGFSSIQDAVTAAGDGDTVLIAAGTYTGAGNTNVTVDAAITIQGVGKGSDPTTSTIINAAGATFGFSVDLAADNAGTVTFKNLAVINAQDDGIRAYDTEVLGALVVDGVRVEDSVNSGLFVSGRKLSSAYAQAGVQSVTVTNSNFVDNGQSATNSANLFLYEFDGDATLTGLTISNGVSGATSAAYGVQISGVDGPLYDQIGPYAASGQTYDVLTPLGSVTFTGVSITGEYRKPGLYVQGYTDTTGLQFGAGNSVSADSTEWGKPIVIDPMADQLPTGTFGTPGNGGSLFDDTSANGSYDLSAIVVTVTGADFNELDGTTQADTIVGTNVADQITGFSGNDNLSGGGGDDVIIGGTGADTMSGGLGNDTFSVDNAGDVVIEAVGEGTDTVNTTVSYALAAGSEVENLTLTDLATRTETFENFTTGPITNGENGWLFVGGPKDQEVIVDPFNGANKVFRMSSDPIVADFSGPFSPSLPIAAGEPGTTAAADSHAISFDFRAVQVADFSRLEVDFGNAAGNDRNNFLVMENVADGIRIQVSEPLPGGAFTATRTLVSGVNAGVSHTLSMVLRYIAGGDNDLIDVYLDGSLIGTTTTFENYRDALNPDHMANAEANQTSRLFFRGGGATVTDGPGGQNQGFLFDNIQNAVFNSDQSLTGNEFGQTITGNAGNNTLSGLGGTDTLVGGLGHDTLVGGADADTLDGGGGIDTAVFTQAIDAGMITQSGGGWQVAAGGAEGTDTLTNIEIVDGLGAGKFLLVGNGGYATIAAAYAAAVDGDTIVLASGIYTENLAINKEITIVGANRGVASDGSRILESEIVGQIHVQKDGVTIDGIQVTNGATVGGTPAGIFVEADDVTITNSVFVGDDTGGMAGVLTSFGNTVSNLTLSNSSFTGWYWGTYFNPSTDIHASGNIFTNTDLIGDDFADTSSITGNTFNGVGSGLGYGVFDTTDDLGAVAPTNTYSYVGGFNNGIYLYGDGDAGGQTVYGTNYNDYFTDAYKSVPGSGDDDTVIGRDGDDYFEMTAGDDTMIGGAGDDTMLGGAGTDTAIYAGTIVTANITAVVDADTTTDGNQAGWRVDATGVSEGTDGLIDVEIVDGLGAGKVLLVGNGGFATIQEAVDASGANDIILVATGTYTEQVTISGHTHDNLMIMAAAGATVTIKAPTVLAQTTTSTSGRAINGVVTVIDATNVHISGIDVDGNGNGNAVVGSNANFIGVAYRNASGGLSNVDITGIRDAYPGGTTLDGFPVQSGNQRGVGVQVDNATDLAFSMTGGSITDFQKNATVFSNAILSVTGVTITGGGAQTIQGQNGIQAIDSTGTIGGNTISAVGYAGPQNIYSGSILLFDNTGMNITNNIITGTNAATTAAKVVGIFVSGGSGGSISGNSVDQADVGIGIYGGITPNGIAVSNNTVTNVDLTDASAAGVDFEPTAALTASYAVDGSAAADILFGAAGADTLNGLGGPDLIEGRGGADTLNGGAGNDVFIIAAGADHAIGEVIDGGGDTDVIRFTSTTPGATLLLTSGVSAVEEIEISDAAGANTGMVALNIDASLAGGAYTLTGNDGDNVLTAGTGANTVNAGGGNDRIVGLADGAADFFNGGTSDAVNAQLGTGGDTVDYASTTGVNVTLSAGGAVVNTGGVGSDTLSGIENIRGGTGTDNLNGDANDNILIGNGGADVLQGFVGNDRLEGGDQNDQLFGGNGNDWLVGGMGADILNGGADADTFVYNLREETGKFLTGGEDQMNNFSSAQGDKFAFGATFFTGLDGNIAPDFDEGGFVKGDYFVVGDVDGDGNYVGGTPGNESTFVVDNTGVVGGIAVLYFDADGDGNVTGVNDVKIATFDITSTVALQNTDLLLI